MPNPLSDALVPIIYKEQLEATANDFLGRYYPEALKTPMAIDPTKLAKEMGLTIDVRNITKDLSIFGQVYFHDTEAEFMTLIKTNGYNISQSQNNFCRPRNFLFEFRCSQ